MNESMESKAFVLELERRTTIPERHSDYSHICDSLPGRGADWKRFQHSIMVLRTIIALAALLSSAHISLADASDASSFLTKYCSDCHADGSSEGGLDLQQLSDDLSDERTYSHWLRIFERVRAREMPPADSEQPSLVEANQILEELQRGLFDAHLKRKGTVLRRLNRREYANTVNDLFGTHLDLESLLPEDGTSHEFDNVGSSLSLSMVHLERYIDAAKLVLDTSIAQTSIAPEPVVLNANYLQTREAERFIGKVWKELPDGAVARFEGGGYPTGMIRGTSIRKAGRYRVKVRGYAYQSNAAITFSVGGTSFQRGSEKPIFGYWSFPPGEPGEVNTIEFEAWLEERYMLAIEPYGIRDSERYRRQNIDDYDGPGLAILDVSLEGPLLDEWPSKGHHLLFDGLQRTEIEPRNPRDKQKSWYRPKFNIETENETEAAQKAIAKIATTLYRRPAKPEETSRFVQLFESEFERTGDFESSLRTTVIAIMCSPSFLFLEEPAGQLSQFAIASRLSYFLIRTTPDAQLLQLAEEGMLAKPAELSKQTERLINDPYFERFIVDFTDSWLGLKDLDFTIPDRKLFPEYDDYLRYSMPLETRSFVRELINGNSPVQSVLKPGFAMLNSRLTAHYNLPAVKGAEIRRVDLPTNSTRGGILSQASVLKVTANGTNTSPVRRGAWVLERIMGVTPRPPPPGIPGVEPDIRGASTLRELLEKHRNVTECNSCHQQIDPPGFALESFNPIGGYRTNFRSLGNGEKVLLQVQGRKVSYRQGPEVDCSGELQNGQHFKDYKEFIDLLATDEKTLTRTLLTKLLTFATGREMGFSDSRDIEEMVTRAIDEKMGFRDLFHLVIQSRIFQSK